MFACKLHWFELWPHISMHRPEFNLFIAFTLFGASSVSQNPWINTWLAECWVAAAAFLWILYNHRTNCACEEVPIFEILSLCQIIEIKTFLLTLWFLIRLKSIGKAIGILSSKRVKSSRIESGKLFLFQRTMFLSEGISVITSLWFIWSLVFFILSTPSYYLLALLMNRLSWPNLFLFTC